MFISQKWWQMALKHFQGSISMRRKHVTPQTFKWSLSHFFWIISTAFLPWLIRAFKAAPSFCHSFAGYHEHITSPSLPSYSSSHYFLLVLTLHHHFQYNLLVKCLSYSYITFTMASFTKDELRVRLTNHGVELPASSAKKEELVALYEEYVEPLERSKGEFSSDDEEVVLASKTKKTSRKSGTPGKTSAPATDKSQIIIEEVLSEENVDDLSQLTDDQLAARLRHHGVDVGPIVGKHCLQLNLVLEAKLKSKA